MHNCEEYCCSTCYVKALKERDTLWRHQIRMFRDTMIDASNISDKRTMTLELFSEVMNALLGED